MKSDAGVVEGMGGSGIGFVVEHRRRSLGEGDGA